MVDVGKLKAYCIHLARRLLLVTSITEICDAHNRGPCNCSVVEKCDSHNRGPCNCSVVEKCDSHNRGPC